MTNDSGNKLDTYFSNFADDPKLPNFMKSFFGQDKNWVKNALKAVLPENISDEVLTNAAKSLHDYKGPTTSTYKPPISFDVDHFFRELFDK
jgi:hypothetical protein